MSSRSATEPPNREACVNSGMRAEHSASVVIFPGQQLGSTAKYNWIDAALTRAFQVGAARDGDIPPNLP